MAATFLTETANEPGRLRELVSGIDALYLSGRTELSKAVVDELEGRRVDAMAEDASVPVVLGNEVFELAPRNFGKYRYRIEHLNGLVGVTTSEHLPALRVQPRAELLHALGPSLAIEWLTSRCEAVFGPVEWSVNRLDLFCDIQGWELEGNDRDRFVCRASRRDTHEEGADWTGFEFGRRGTGTVAARIYDKTAEIVTKGNDYWYEVWGDSRVPDMSVMRIEFELGRQGLKEFGVSSPEDAMAEASGIWAGVTEQWLTYRIRTGDETRSRWPLADEWLSVQSAQLRGTAIGLDRVRKAKSAGHLRLILPALIGYTARMAQLVEVETLDQALGALRTLVLEDEIRRGLQFQHRVERLRREAAFE